MAVQFQGLTGTVGEIDPYKRAQRVALVGRGPSHATAGVTGVMAAALAGNSPIFAMRLDPAAGAGYKVYIDKIRLEYMTITAFTVPITAGRRLSLFRGSGAACAGGAALAAVKKANVDALSETNAAQGGDIRIATTAALTVVGVTFETQWFRDMTLAHVGAAGAYSERVWEFTPADAGGPVVLDPGELIAIRNPVAMDAAGTFQLGISVDWYEGVI